MAAKPKAKRLSAAEKKKRMERVKAGYAAAKKAGKQDKYFKGTATEKYATQSELAEYAKKRTKRKTRSA